MRGTNEGRRSRSSSPMRRHVSVHIPLSPRSTLAKIQWQEGDEKSQEKQDSKLSALGALHAEEKDGIIVYLLQKVKDQKAMQEAAIRFGEEIAAKLVMEQHARNEEYEMKIHELTRELHQATHAHPEVERLTSIVHELKIQLENERQNVQSAIRKCRRSREREKQLKMTIDPLWE